MPRKVNPSHSVRIPPERLGRLSMPHLPKKIKNLKTLNRIEVTARVVTNIIIIILKGVVKRERDRVPREVIVVPAVLAAIQVEAPAAPVMGLGWT